MKIDRVEEKPAGAVLADQTTWYHLHYEELDLRFCIVLDGPRDVVGDEIAKSVRLDGGPNPTDEEIEDAKNDFLDAWNLAKHPKNPEG